MVKADGLASGKGVYICKSKPDAINAVNEIFDGKFGKAEVILVEEFLIGEEMSYFIICDGSSNIQVNSIISSINKVVRKGIKEKPYQIEGIENSEWVLMDYVDVVVHVFKKEKRNFYDIESLWGDAIITKIKSSY